MHYAVSVGITQVLVSLEGCTKRSVRNPGRSPGVFWQNELPVRQYLAIGEVIARYCLTDSHPAA